MSITMQTGPNTARPAVASLAARMLALCYGGVAYLIFLGTFLYAVGFVSGYVVPKTVDGTPGSEHPSSTVTALLINLVVMTIFVLAVAADAGGGLAN